jgi:hypothetical protein
MLRPGEQAIVNAIMNSIRIWEVTNPIVIGDISTCDANEKKIPEL